MMVGLLFTGTVLKWDQEAYEALAHFTWVADGLGILGVPLTDEVLVNEQGLFDGLAGHDVERELAHVPFVDHLEGRGFEA